MKKSVPAGSALLYVIRPENIMAAAQTYRIFVNDARVADVRTGFYFTHVVPPGPVTISAKVAPTPIAGSAPFAYMNKPSLELFAHAGEVSFVKIGVSFFGGPTLEAVDEAQGEALVEHAQEGKSGAAR